MFSSGTPLPTERRTRGSTVRRSQSRAGSIANLAGSDAGTPPPSARAGARTRTLAARAGSSRRQSLLPTGRTPSRAGSRLNSVALFGEDDAGGEDAMVSVDEDSEQVDNQGILLKSDTHTVSILGGAPRANLPAEVLDVLANSDFYSDPHTASIDINAGYACLVGKTKCYVWNIEQIHKDPATSVSEIVKVSVQSSVLRRPKYVDHDTDMLRLSRSGSAKSLTSGHNVCTCAVRRFCIR